MPYRLVGRADDRIDALLLESARAWGIEGAARYNRLLVAAMNVLATCPPWSAHARWPISLA